MLKGENNVVADALSRLSIDDRKAPPGSPAYGSTAYMAEHYGIYTSEITDAYPMR